MADANFVLLTGVSTKAAQLRRKASDQAKAEFSFQVDRPFLKPDGDPVSDLFLIDAWGALAQWCSENVMAGSRLIIVGTLNKESFRTRGGGKEHLTLVKAKYVTRIDACDPSQHLDTERLKADGWDLDTVIGHLSTLLDALEEGADQEG